MTFSGKRREVSATRSWSAEEVVIPSFGFHPWFSHLVSNDLDDALKSVEGQLVSKDEHYKSVLTPEPSDDIISGLPDPLPLSTVLDGIRFNLRAFPAALVGEIGMDRGFRIPWHRRTPG